MRNSEPGTPGQRGAAGSGIFLHASQNQIVVQNLIGRCDNVGVFPVLRPDREGSGNGRYFAWISITATAYGGSSKAMSRA